MRKKITNIDQKKITIPVFVFLAIFMTSMTGFGQIEGLKPVVTGNDTGSVNWAHHYIEASGWSAIDTARFKVPAQARLMAQRGAIVDAQRNLLETIQGVRIVGETTVKDYITQNDYVYSRLDGVIKGAEMVGEPIVTGNSVKVKMRVPIYGPPKEKKESVADLMRKAEKKSNPGGDNSQPQMFTTIKDANNNDLYNSQLDPTQKALSYYQLTEDALKKLKNGKVPLMEVEKLSDGTLKIPESQKEQVSAWKKIGKAAFKVGKFIVTLL